MAIVTISHQLGSGGGRIAEIVTTRLGYECVSSEILAKAAHEYGLTEERLAELGEVKPSLLDRLEAETQTYIAVLENAVLEVALPDDIIVLGRGAQWLLRGIPHVIRVRIVAAFDERVRRLTDSLVADTGRRHGLTAAHDAIVELVRRDDADKRGRMKYLYDRDIDDPELYDVIINATRDEIDLMADTVVVLARDSRFTTTDESRRCLLNRAVASRVRVALMMDERTRDATHSAIEAEAASVRIASSAPRASVAAVAHSVSGVENVRVEPLADGVVRSLWHLYQQPTP